MSKHYKILTFYKRSHEQSAPTLAEAINIVKAKALTSTASHYTEVWEMTTDVDGELVATYENSNVQLTSADVPPFIPPRAVLVKF